MPWLHCLQIPKFSLGSKCFTFSSSIDACWIVCVGSYQGGAGLRSEKNWGGMGKGGKKSSNAVIFEDTQ